MILEAMITRDILINTEISRVSGNLLGVGDGFPNTSLVLVEHGYNLHHSKLEVYSDIQMEAINVQHLWFTATVAASRSLPTVDKLHCPVSFNTFLKVNSFIKAQTSGTLNLSPMPVPPTFILQLPISVKFKLTKCQPHLFWHQKTRPKSLRWCASLTRLILLIWLGKLN